MDAGGFTVRLSSDVKETNQNGDAKKMATMSHVTLLLLGSTERSGAKVAGGV
jgi:hypothetical protein